MVPAINIFLDSCILIEYTKGKGIDFLDNLINQNCNLYFNQIVASEFFHYIAGSCKKSPLAAKMSKEIHNVFKENNPIAFLENFQHVNCSQEIVEQEITFSTKYNLLPNDALILATCKIFDYKYLATYDPDFNEPCKQEGIVILNHSQTIE